MQLLTTATHHRKTNARLTTHVDNTAQLTSTGLSCERNVLLCSAMRTLVSTPIGSPICSAYSSSTIEYFNTSIALTRKQQKQTHETESEHE